MSSFRNKCIRILYSHILHNNIKCAKKLGVRIGNDCRVLDDPGRVFGTEPWLIHIGNHVEITHGVQFLSHEGALWCVRGLYPEMSDLDQFKPTYVGDNVMIGLNSIIMPGVIIGDNAIVGAHSVVTKDVPSNTVVAGVPAKPISTIDAFITAVLNSKYTVHTKGMSSGEKRAYIEKEHPEWFEFNR